MLSDCGQQRRDFNITLKGFTLALELMGWGQSRWDSAISTAQKTLTKLGKGGSESTIKPITINLMCDLSNILQAPVCVQKV